MEAGPLLALQLLWRSGCAGAELVHFYWARGGTRITFEELEFPGLDLRSVFLIFFCAFFTGDHSSLFYVWVKFAGGAVWSSLSLIWAKFQDWTRGSFLVWRTSFDSRFDFIWAMFSAVLVLFSSLWASVYVRAFSRHGKEAGCQVFNTYCVRVFCLVVSYFLLLVLCGILEVGEDRFPAGRRPGSDWK